MKKNKLKFAAYIVALVTTILVGIMTIPVICFPLAWMIPLTITILFMSEGNKRASPSFIFWVGILLFNPAISILLLYSENKYTRRRWAYYYAILFDVLCGLFLIPLAWMIPFTVKLNKASSEEYNPSVAFKVCLTLFFGIIPLTFGVLPGVIYFTEGKKKDYSLDFIYNETR